MVSVEQVQRGLADYIDREFTSKLTGWQKWVVGAAGAMYANKLGDIVEQLRTVPAVSALGLFPPGGGIDVDAAYKALYAQAQKSPATFDMPLIGSVTLNSADVQSLYDSIMRA